ncbi:Hypothetical predicted protein [Podarcis lilfordi]|uniref:Uncharacterized protein n=1 Tax=Podarcis lilfordi TaxID=74358 RepID=A0AA35JWT4_9SAUR|nr:Hypothetical predicted protein [Podarcis lilfordi]
MASRGPPRRREPKPPAEEAPEARSPTDEAGAANLSPQRLRADISLIQNDAVDDTITANLHYLHQPDKS